MWIRIHLGPWIRIRRNKLKDDIITEIPQIRAYFKGAGLNIFFLLINLLFGDFIDLDRIRIQFC